LLSLSSTSLSASSNMRFSSISLSSNEFLVIVDE
jgi:hypothetical protein